MILSYVALALAILALVLLAVGQLLNRKGKANEARTERTLAALARHQGQHETADRHERRAAVYERNAWPFRVPPQTTFEIPGGLVTFDDKLTDDQVAELTERWKQTQGLSHVRVDAPAGFTDDTWQTWRKAWDDLVAPLRPPPPPRRRPPWRRLRRR